MARMASHRKRFSSLFSLVLLSCSIEWISGARSSRENECAAYCSENQAQYLFKYEVGKSYLYQYRTRVKTLITGNTEEYAGTEVDTTVIVSVLTGCEFTLQLQNSSLLIDSSKVHPYSHQLDSRPLRFWFNQGRIERLCPGFDADPEFILNVKRGILSAFQTASATPESLHYETDISGLCRTRSNTSSYDPETGIRISKVKNLAHCSGRAASGLPMRGSMFDIKSALKSEQSCVQDYSPDSLILSKSECEETHVVKPFSQGLQGASVLVKQSLTHVETKSTNELSLAFDNFPLSGAYTTLVYTTGTGSLLDSTTEDDTLARSLRQDFTLLAKSLRAGVSGSSPELYFEFLTRLRTVSANVMSKLLLLVEGLEQKLLLSLIAQSGTDESLGLLVTQYDSRSVSDAEIVGLLSEIQAYQIATAFSVEKLYELSEKDSIRVEALLPLGSLIYRYCKTVDCQTDETVRTVIRNLDHSLPAFCRTYTNKDTLVTSAILKAIGNSGIYTSNLKACMFEPIGHIEVRLNAIRALRHVSCPDRSVSNTYDLFLNVEEHVEIRLQSYLICIECANSTLLNRVLHQLHDEPVRQVKSFILSHLMNLQQSTSTSSNSVRLRQILRNKPLSSFYANGETPNPLKYSTHFGYSFNIPTFQADSTTEKTGFFDATNQDGESPSNQINMESNLIYSNSYLPSSLYMNLSLNLFEEEVQLFEFGTRIQGLESRIESLFGKNGYFPDESVMKLLKSFHADHAESILDPRLNQVRSDSLARLRQDKLDLDEDNDLERDAFEPDTAREYLSYFVRTGGQDVKFGHYEKGLNELVAKFGRGFFEGGLFGAARDKENNLTNIHSHQLYLNNTASISSISGLPLVFHLDLINTFNFNYNYEFDASDLFRGQNLNFGLHLNPSVHLQFKSFLGVDLEFAEKLTKVEEELEDNDGVETEFDDRIDEVIRRIKNGLELKAKVATESFVDVKLSLNKGSLVDFKINVPRKHLELLDVSTRLLLHRGLETSSSQPYHTTGQTQSGANLISKTIPYPSLAQAYEAYDACWPDTLSDVVGLEFCSKLSAFNYSRLDAFNFSRTSPEQIVTAQFPLTGDFSWRIYLNKIDSFSRYEFTASNNFNIINSRTLKSFVLTFNTPGSLVDRKIHASLSIDPVNPALKLRLQCPLGNMELTGRYSAKDNHKGLTLLAHLNRQEIVNLDANLIVKNGVNTRYEPSLVIFYKNALFIDIRGHVDYIVGVKYNADLAVKGLTQRPIDISGDLAFSSNRTVVTLHMNSDQFGYFKIHGTLKNSPQGSFLAKGHVNYDIGKSAQAHQGHFLLKFDQYEKASLYKSNTHFKLESTQYENINLDLRHVFQSADHLFDSRLDFNIFGNPWSSRALYRNLHQRDSRGEMRESEREEGGEEIGGGAKGLKRSFELIGSLRCDKKQLHYKGQILHESTSSNTTSLVLAQLNDSTQLLGSYYLGANKQGGQTLELRAVSPWSGAKLRAEYLPYDANTMDATVQLEWHSVNINQYQLHGHLNYVYDPSTSLSKVSANFVLGNALDVNSASLVTDSLQYQLDAQWTSNSIQFNVYLPNNRHISGDLLYIASDTRGADYRTELTVSLKLNAHDAVQFDLLYSRDGRTHQELIATKLGWRHKFTNGNKMATSSNDWKEVEFNVGYKLFEKLNLELVLPEYYFHVNVDAKYLGLYNANSLNSELSWGSSRQTVSLIKSEAHFQLNFPHSYLNVTVLTPFSSWETLTLDSTFRLNNRSQDVKMELQATGRLPSHEIHLFSHFTYNPHTNRFSTSLQTNNTLFSIESINFKIDHSNNGTVVTFSCDPGLDNNSLVSFQYEIIESIHSGHIEFFTPFKSVKFLSADLSFHRRLTEFSAKFTPFDILRGRLTAKGDYLFNYALGNGKENASENQNSPSGTTEQRFELNLQTPLKELKRLNIIFTNTQSTEYRLKFTLNDDISFANVNVTNSNQLPLAINAHVDIAKIVHDLRLKFILRSNEIAILVSENGEDLFDLKYEGTNNYIIQLKFAGNSIYGEAELNDNSMNFVGKWNNYTLNAESDYSITYKDLWFDCLIKAKIKSNSFKNDYDLLISHDSDSNNINNNVFNTDIKINQLTIIHKLIIQMDSLLHNKWINSISER